MHRINFSELNLSKEVLKAMLTIDMKEYDEENFIVPKFNGWILSIRI